MEELYAEYGKLIIQTKILQAQLAEVEQKIVSGLNNTNKKEEVKEVIK